MISTQSSLTSKVETLASRNSQLRTVQSHASCAAVVKSDDTVLAFSALYVGGTGAVAIKQTTEGDVITFVGVPAGTVLPVSGVRVMAATTATNIVSLA